ncbi:MAG: beta-eliminating lyase-related protein [Pseudomonadota bacterium]
MKFASDNSHGAPAEIIAALYAVSDEPPMGSYGTDPVTEQVKARFSEIFERQVEVFLISTGTAANAIALSSAARGCGAILCHREAHVFCDECGAFEHMSAGGKLLPVEGDGAKMTPDAVAAIHDGFPKHRPHGLPMRALSITQATECERVYQPDEVAALAAYARSKDMIVHMDGARFANAVVSTGAMPAEITWKAGVDVLSFGATKNGCLAAEAIVVFDKLDSEDIANRRMRTGHLLSKGRFIAAQLEAYLAGNLWLKLAASANYRAKRLSDGLAAIPGVEIAWPTDINEVFAVMPVALAEALQAKGAVFYDWFGAPPARLQPLPADRKLYRLVCGYGTSEDEIDSFLELASVGAEPPQMLKAL